jgi:hypothetical protein
LLIAADMSINKKSARLRTAEPLCRLSGHRTVPTAHNGLTEEEEDGFHDILTGTDGLYTSLPYYDFTTGMCTIDMGQKNLAVRTYLQSQ